MNQPPYNIEPYLKGQATVFWLGILSLAVGFFMLLHRAIRRTLITILVIVILFFGFVFVHSSGLLR